MPILFPDPRGPICLTMETEAKDLRLLPTPGKCPPSVHTLGTSAQLVPTLTSRGTQPYSGVKGCIGSISGTLRVWPRNRKQPPCGMGHGSKQGQHVRSPTIARTYQTARSKGWGDSGLLGATGLDQSPHRSLLGSPWTLHGSNPA